MEKPRRIAVFRSSDYLEETISGFREAGIEAVGYATMASTCRSGFDKASLGIVESADYVIFVSRSAASCALENLPFYLPKNAKVTASGISTGRFLERNGIEVSFMPQIGGLSSIEDWLSTQKPGRVLLLLREGITHSLPKLEELGFAVHCLPVYSVKYLKLNITEDEILKNRCAVLFSPSAVDSLRKSLEPGDGDLLEGVTAICVGVDTKAAAEKVFKKAVLSKSNEVSGVIKAVMVEMDGN